jgi:hypothetical protein
MADTIRRIDHKVYIDLDTPQPFTDIVGRTRQVHALRIEYSLSSIAHRVDVVVEYKDSTALVPPVAEIPAWIQARIDAHKPAGPALQLT